MPALNHRKETTMRLPDLSLDHPRIGTLLATSRRVFRLHTLQEYDLPEERDQLARHRARDLPKVSPAVARWCRLVENAAAQGREFQRVHVVTEPVSRYLEYRFLWETSYAVAAGEHVRVIPIPERRWPARIPHQDMWLFDDTLIVLDHNPDGALLGVNVTTDPELLQAARTARNRALDKSVTFSSYFRDP